jgi:prepilin-type processing-associated H-X9-DG protein
VNTGILPPNGVFTSSKAIKISDVTDGTSNTAAFSEHVIGDFNQAVSTPVADTYRPGTHPLNSDDAVLFCMVTNVQDLTQQGVSDVGSPWLYGYHSTTSYWHSAPPNSRSCMFPPSRISTTATSLHPGGVNVLFLDGSVKFIKNSVSYNTWYALGTHSGGEIISSDAY